MLAEDERAAREHELEERDQAGSLVDQDQSCSS